MAVEYGSSEKSYTLRSTHELMCVEEAEGPPCDFPTIHTEIPVSNPDQRARHECLPGELCQNLYTSMVGSCTPCAQSNNSTWMHTLEPSVYVATPLHTVRLRGTIESLTKTLSEILYVPLSNWNSASHGFDAVVANGLVTYILVAPVNDPPSLTLANVTINAKEGADTLITGISVWDDDIGDNCDTYPQRWWVGNGTLYPEYEINVGNASHFMPTTTNAAAASNMELEIEVEHGSIYFSHVTGLELISEVPYGMKVISRGSICDVREALSHIYYSPLSMSDGGKMDLSYEVQRIDFTSISSLPLGSSRIHFNLEWLGGNSGSETLPFVLELQCAAFISHFEIGEGITVESIAYELNGTISAMAIEDAVYSLFKSCEVALEDAWLDILGNATTTTYLPVRPVEVTGNLSSILVIATNVTQNIGEHTWEIVIIYSAEAPPPAKNAFAVFSNGTNLDEGKLGWVIHDSLMTHGSNETFRLSGEKGDTLPISINIEASELEDLIMSVVGTDVHVTVESSGLAGGPSWLVSYTAPGDFPPLVPDVSWVSVTELVNGYTPQDTLSVKVTDATGLSDTALIHIDVELIDMPPTINFLIEEREFSSSSGEQVLHLTASSSGVDGEYPVHNVVVTTIPRQEQAILSVSVLASSGDPRLKLAVPVQGSRIELEQHSGYLSVKGFPQDVNDALTTLHWHPSRTFIGQEVVLDSVSVTELIITAGITSDVGSHTRKLMIYSDIESLGITLIKLPSESIAVTSNSVCTTLEGINFEKSEWETITEAVVSPSPVLVSIQADHGFICKSYLVLDNFEDIIQVLQQSVQYTPPTHYVGEDRIYITVLHPGSGMYIKDSVNITVKSDAVKRLKPKVGGNLLPELQGEPLQLNEDSDLLVGPNGIVLPPNEEILLHSTATLTVSLAAYNGNVTFKNNSIPTRIEESIRVNLIEGRMLQLQGNNLEGLNSYLERVLYRPPENYEGWDELVVNVTETLDGIDLNGVVTTRVALVIFPVNDAPVLTAMNNDINDAVQGQLIDIPVILSDVDADDPMGDGLVNVYIEAEMEGDGLIIGGAEIVHMPPFLFETAEEEEEPSNQQQKALTFTAPLESAAYALSHLMLYPKYAGNQVITVTVNDTGNYGSGGAMVTSITLDINVTESKISLIPTWVVPSGVLVVKQGSELLVSGIRMDIPWSNTWTEQETSTIMHLLIVSITLGTTTNGSSLKTATALPHSNATAALGSTPSLSVNVTNSDGGVKLVGTLFSICQVIESSLVYVPRLGFTGIDTLILEAEAVAAPNLDSLSCEGSIASMHGTWNWSTTSHVKVLVINEYHLSQLLLVEINGNGTEISAQYEEIVPVTTFSLVSIYDSDTVVTLSVKCDVGILTLGPAHAGLWIQSQSDHGLVSISGLPANINNFLSSGNLLYEGPTVNVSDAMVERRVDLCAWIERYAGDEAVVSHICVSIVIPPIERWALVSIIRVSNGSSASDGLLHMKEGGYIYLNSIFSISASGKEDGELFEMNVSAVTGSREGQIWFSHNTSLTAQTPPPPPPVVTVSGSGSALLSLVGMPKDLTFLLEHIFFHPPHLFNGVAWLKLSISSAGHSSPILSSKTVPVAIEAVNNPPQIHVTTGSTIVYGLQGQITEIGSCGIYVTDPDAHEAGFSASVNVMVSIVEGIGTLELSQQYSPELVNTLTIEYYSGSISLVGPIKALNMALISLRFIPDSKWSGMARILFEADDLGHNGFGGPQKAAPVELVVHVAAIIAPPYIIAPQYYSGIQGQAIELMNVTIMDGGPDPNAEIQLHVSSTQGEEQSLVSRTPLI